MRRSRALRSRSASARRTLPSATAAAAAPIAKIKRTYRFHLLIKAARRDALSRALRAARDYAEQAGIPRSSLVFDMDAISLM